MYFVVQDTKFHIYSFRNTHGRIYFGVRKSSAPRGSHFSITVIIAFLQIFRDIHIYIWLPSTGKLEAFLLFPFPSQLTKPLVMKKNAKINLL